jgi:hypothetical protein
VGLAVSARAQDLLPPERNPIVNQLIDSKAKQNSLKCYIHLWKPSLGFNLRYQTGFVISASLGLFAPGERLVAFLRITPQGRPPVLLGESFDIPSILPDMVGGVDPKSLGKLELNMSGGFAIGEGHYAVGLLLLDKRGRSYYKRWNLRTGKYSKHAVPLTLKPQTVAPLLSETWNGQLDAKGVRVTLLLHASPMDPFAAKLYAWDRGFLLQALASLLEQLPCQSVKIIAFNLDHQREIFRQERFDAAGFSQLATALHELELVTVPYQALQRGNWLKFLVRLAQEQTSAKDPSDAVVFLGPPTRFSSRVPKKTVRSFERTSSHFFYFTYYSPWTSYFPDAIDYLTRDLHGTVFRIKSGEDLGLAIQEMLAQIEPIRN